MTDEMKQHQQQRMSNSSNPGGNVGGGSNSPGGKPMTETIGSAQYNRCDGLLQTPKKSSPPPFGSRPPLETKNSTNDGGGVSDENHNTLNSPNHSSPKSSSSTITKRPRRAAAVQAEAKFTKRHKTTAASSSSSITPSTSSSSSSSVASIEGNDNVETIGEGEYTAIILTSVPGDLNFDVHEAQFGTAFDDYEEDEAEATNKLQKAREAAEEKYPLTSKNAKGGSSSYDLKKLFRLPDANSYKEPEEKLNLLKLCEKKDGCGVQKRCELAMKVYDSYIRKRVGVFVGGSNCYAIYVETQPGNGQWVVGQYCGTLKGSEKHYEQGEALGEPGSLRYAIGGNNSAVTGMKPGEMKPYQRDMNDNFLFRVLRVDVMKMNPEDLKKEAARNTAEWDSAMVRMKEAKTFRKGAGNYGYNKDGKQQFFSVTKAGDQTYGTKYFSSLRSLRQNGDGHIGSYHYDPKTGKSAGKIGSPDLPSKIGDVRPITTKKRGHETHSTYNVKCISWEEYKQKTQV